MNVNLVVVRPFAGHPRGALITDPAAIAAILAGEHALGVVRVLNAPPSIEQPAEQVA